jgi:hypothetical protein
MTKNELKKYNHVLEENRRYRDMMEQAKVDLHKALSAKILLEIQLEQMKKAYEHDKSVATQRVVELEAELRFAKARMEQALDIAVNNAGFASSVGGLLQRWLPA